MRERLEALKRLAMFALTTGVGSLAGLIAVPVIIAGAGQYQWGVQAALQSAAGLFGVLVAFGWGTTGAAEVSVLDPAERPQWYAHSLVSRLYLFCAVYPIMVLVMGLLNPGYIPLVLVGSAAFLMPYLGASWYFIGEAQPTRLFRCDALPQVTGTAVSVVVMLLSHSLVATMATQFVFNLSASVISARVILRSSAVPVHMDWRLRSTLGRLAEQRHAVATSAASSLYVSTPLLVLNLLHPGTMALYAMGDKLFRFALTAFAPILQFVQGWIPEGGRATMLHRVRQAARLTPLISLLGAGCVVGLGPWAAGILSASHIEFGFTMALPFAVVFFAVSITQIVGLACLVQLGRTRDLARSTVLGALAGVPLIVAGAWLDAAHGVAWALALSEIVVLVYQMVVLVRAVRQTQGEAGLS